MKPMKASKNSISNVPLRHIESLGKYFEAVIYRHKNNAQQKQPLN